MKKAFLLVLRRVVGITVMKLKRDIPYHCLCDPCFKEEAEERRYNKAIQKQRIIPYLRSPSATFLWLYFFFAYTHHFPKKKPLWVQSRLSRNWLTIFFCCNYTIQLLQVSRTLVWDIYLQHTQTFTRSLNKPLYVPNLYIVQHVSHSC